MADGMFDYEALCACFYPIVPFNASMFVKNISPNMYITKCSGGSGAVAEDYILGIGNANITNYSNATSGGKKKTNRCPAGYYYANLKCNSTKSLSTSGTH
jgi:hypothetical protein